MPEKEVGSRKTTSMYIPSRKPRQTISRRFGLFLRRTYYTLAEPLSESCMVVVLRPSAVLQTRIRNFFTVGLANGGMCFIPSQMDGIPHQWPELATKQSLRVWATAQPPPRDICNLQEAKIVFYNLAESVAAR